MFQYFKSFFNLFPYLQSPEIWELYLIVFEVVNNI